MFSDKSKLNNLCNEEKQRINGEIDKTMKQFENEKENIVSEVPKMFYNAPKFNNPSLADFKYKLVLLNDKDLDCIFMKKTIDSAIERCFDSKDIVLKIHKVVSTDNTVTESETLNCSNLLLLHGTKGQNVEGILKEGFKPSEIGSRGPGIYLTNSFQIAARYGKCYENEEENIKHKVYLFVNKVKQTNASKSPKKSSSENCDGKKLSNTKISFAKPNQSFRRDVKRNVTKPSEISKLCDEYLSNDPFLKVFDKFNFFLELKKQASVEDPQPDKFDGHGNKILNGTFDVGHKEKRVFLAHHDLVSPLYLIEIEIRQYLEVLVANVLYNDLKIMKYPRRSKIGVQKDLPEKSFKHPLELLVAELEDEIAENQQAQVDYMKYAFDNNLKEIMKQLLSKKNSSNENLKRKASDDSDVIGNKRAHD